MTDQFAVSAVVRSHRTLWFTGTTIAIVVASALFFLGPGERSPCLVLAATGVPCPGCGMTRAAASLLRGEWTAMWRFHPLAPFVTVQAVVVWAYWGWMVFARRERVDETVLFRLLVINSVLLGLVWFARLFMGSLPGV
jgi:hypothetical protein